MGYVNKEQSTSWYAKEEVETDRTAQGTREVEGARGSIEVVQVISLYAISKLMACQCFNQSCKISS
jgi:hypothetical protein